MYMKVEKSNGKNGNGCMFFKTSCGADVSTHGTHGLSCRFSKGRHSRHAAVNDIVKRSLESAKIPCHLEPTGLFRSDGKRPDGASIVPWKGGKVLVWDATCPDTLAPSYSTLAVREAGAVAADAEYIQENSKVFAPLILTLLRSRCGGNSGGVRERGVSFLQGGRTTNEAGH